ncbi:transposase [Vibrio astriarenae]|nr:transposase [Vibrio sp. C7]
MVADSLWTPRSQRKAKVYQPRYRRDCFGELIQIDGSHHDWFEGRSDKCCLLVFIDDLTFTLINEPGWAQTLAERAQPMLWS